MALMAVLRCWSRSMVSMLTFWRKKRTTKMATKAMQRESSNIVKPRLVFIVAIVALWRRKYKL